MKSLILFTTLMAVLLVLPLQAQDEMESVPIHKRERGFSFALSTNGLGLGGFYRFALPNFYHLGLNAEFFIVRDEDEIELVDAFGNLFKLNNNNRLFLIPVDVELKKRLFVNDIEDDFRPHIMLQAGFIYGMNFPNERIVNGQIIRPDNEYQFTYNLLVGFGVDFTTRKDFFATIRPQYRITFFNDEIAGKKNHSTFEIKFEIGGQL